MSFMKPQVHECDYYEVDTTAGAVVIPLSVSGSVETNADLERYTEGSVDWPEDEPEVKHGWLARMSAPGYMDCTEWSAFKSEYEAWEYLVENHMDDTHVMLDVPSHFLSALINGDTTGFELRDECAYGDFIINNPEAMHVETCFPDAHHFNGYQDVTPCICRIKEQA